jgi:hypothetical protein
VIQNQPDSPFTNLRRILVRRFAHHGSTFSRVGASGNPGAVQIVVLPPKAPLKDSSFNHPCA